MATGGIPDARRDAGGHEGDYRDARGPDRGWAHQGSSRRRNDSDWFLIGPDGTGTIDFRGTLDTDDGATIYMHGLGRCDMSGGVGEAGVLYGAPMFETGDERYAWLNRVQAVFRGVVAGDGMFYDEYFELR